MEYNRRSSIIAGLLLVLMGSWFLVDHYIPGFDDRWWPLIVIGVGAALLLSALLTGISALAIPACIVGGIGGLLYWQNATDNFESWAYAWTLIPGFVGVGLILSGILSGGSLQQSVHKGGHLLVISAALFLIFGSFLGGFWGRPLWPVLLIVLGLGLILWPMVRSMQRQ